jgi:HlyD family secretion protein
MSRRRLSRPRKWAGYAAALAAVVAIVTAVSCWRDHLVEAAKPPRERYQVVDVKRTDLFPKRTAGGHVESSKKTVIECELERISVGVRGAGAFSAGGASTLLSIVPDGSEVKKGDVLAVLDSADYEELTLQQRITVERVQADYRQTELTLEVAKLALVEYRDGTVEDARREMLGKLALAESDLERAKIRTDWSERMNAKGYAPKSQVASDRYTQSVNMVSLARQKTAYELFFRYQAPKNLRYLEGQVKMAESNLDYQQLRRKRMLDRLALLEKQLALCTIRAPHDGFVIYANKPERDVIIEPGMAVRQRQDLMYLPDLNQMEVVAMLHESIMEDVKSGMAVDVELEGMPNHRLEGHVVSIAPLPAFSWISDVRYFPGIIKLDHSIKGIRPGMTAHVEIRLGRRDQVLTVPAEAVVSQDGHDVCYVAHDDGLERREVTLGQSNQELLEITDGLGEGEQVVLNPNQGAADFEDELRAYPTPPAIEPTEESATVAAVTDPQPGSAVPIPSATH